MATKVFHVVGATSKEFEDNLNDIIKSLEAQGFDIHNIKYNESIEYFSAIIITKILK